MSTIIDGRSAPLYAGTSYSLTCNYTLDELIDINLSIVVSWTLNGSRVDTSQSRIKSSSNSLVFNPLSLLDSGSYTCGVNVSARQYVTVPELQESSPVVIVVEGMFTVSM